MMRWTMSTSLSVRGEACSRISRRSNRRVSSVVLFVYIFFPFLSFLNISLTEMSLLLTSVWMVANMVCKYFRSHSCLVFDIFAKIHRCPKPLP